MIGYQQLFGAKLDLLSKTFAFVKFNLFDTIQLFFQKYTIKLCTFWEIPDKLDLMTLHFIRTFGFQMHFFAK